MRREGVIGQTSFQQGDPLGLKLAFLRRGIRMDGVQSNVV